jgi:DNA repair protein RadC
MSASASDTELLASIIGFREAKFITGHPTAAILEKSAPDLVALGLTSRAASRISAAAEIARRFQPSVEASRPMTQPQIVLSHVTALREAQQETLVALLLDSKLCLIRVIPIAVGSLTQVALTAREVFRQPLDQNANALILCHNHTSGDVHPSRHDILFTSAMAAAGLTLGINLVDHLIVAKRAYFSFRVAGLLSQPPETARNAVPDIACADAIPTEKERQFDVRPNLGARARASARRLPSGHRRAR